MLQRREISRGLSAKTASDLACGSRAKVKRDEITALADAHQRGVEDRERFFHSSARLGSCHYSWSRGE